MLTVALTQNPSTSLELGMHAQYGPNLIMFLS